MLSIKKFLLLAVMGIAAVVVVAVPASGSGEEGEWLHEGEAIGSHHTFKLTRNLQFKVLGETITCEYHPTLTVLENGKSEFTGLGITTNTCKGTGVFEGCVMEKDSATDLGWPVTLDKALKIFTLHDFTLHTQFKCPKIGEQELFFEFETVTGTPDDPEAINEFSISGVGTVNGGATSVQISGELEITEGDAGTYGIG